MKRTILKIEEKFSRELAIHHWLLISSSFSVFLLAARIIMRQDISYIFLAWNLVLAYIPYCLANWLSVHKEIQLSRLKLFLIVVAWLLFMPNSFYIVTDLFHLDNFPGDSWYDLTLILSFAWNGILFGILSLGKMESILKFSKGKLVAGLVVWVVMWLNAFGVYIGRFLRFNSWDIILDPFSLFQAVGEILLNPYDHKYVWAMTACFSFFMTILYYTVKKLAKVF
jgi:uncharacterized membrane protein